MAPLFLFPSSAHYRKKLGHILRNLIPTVSSGIISLSGYF